MGCETPIPIKAVADDHFLLKAAVMFTRLTAVISSQPQTSHALQQPSVTRLQRKNHTQSRPAFIVHSTHLYKAIPIGFIPSTGIVQSSTAPSQWGRLP